MWQRLKDDIGREHSLFDDEIRAWVRSYTQSGGKIFCGKGCRECCNLTVNCTYTEALGIAEILTESQAGRVAEHVSLLRGHIHEASDLKSYLRMHRQKIGYCPFLEDDGTCGIYDKRPFSCRSLLATKESRWCAADFSSLSDSEKRTFLESLDTTAVSFPMHYVAAAQERGRELEYDAKRHMAKRLGFSLYGNLPCLVFLEREFQLSRTMLDGYEAVALRLDQTGLRHPFLLTVDGP